MKIKAPIIFRNLITDDSFGSSLFYHKSDLSYLLDLLLGDLISIS